MKFLLAGFIVFLSYSYCLAADCEQTVKDTAKKFVQAQYDGLLMVWEKSERLVMFSKKREILEKKKDPEFGGRVLSLSADPIVLVRSYSIRSCVQHNDNATVDVTYDQIATTVGEGDISRKIVPNVKQTDIKFNLIKKSDRWYVIDPPIPLILKEKVKECFDESVKSMKVVIQNPLASQAQRKQFEKYVEELSTLEKLK